MLRALLQEITDSPDVGTHTAQIGMARQSIPHTIEVLAGAKDNRRYNCVMFALGIETDDEYFSMAYRCPDDIHANTNFVKFLVDRGLLVERLSPEVGSLVAYLDDGVFRHIGQVKDNGRIQSKWGIGHLYEHAIFETPISYGSTVRYFGPVDRDTVLNAFSEFAELNGVSFAQLGPGPQLRSFNSI